MVDLPLEEEDDDAIEEAPADITVDVRVPAGVYPGDEFLIEALGSEFRLLSAGRRERAL